MLDIIEFLSCSDDKTIDGADFLPVVVDSKQKALKKFTARFTAKVKNVANIRYNV